MGTSVDHCMAARGREHNASSTSAAAAEELVQTVTALDILRAHAPSACHEYAHKPLNTNWPFFSGRMQIGHANWSAHRIKTHISLRLR